MARENNSKYYGNKKNTKKFCEIILFLVQVAAAAILVDITSILENILNFLQCWIIHKLYGTRAPEFFSHHNVNLSYTGE
jgi:hypothetical protein